MRYPTLSLRHVLLFVSLLFLLLPVGGLYYLRIYENALIRQTESELISQAAFVAVLYAHEIQTTLESRKQADMDYGIPLPIHEKPGEKFELIPPQLDLRWNKIYPPRPIGRLTPFKPESIAWEVSAKIMPILKGVQKMTLSGIKILDPHGVVVTGPEEQGLSFADTREGRWPFTRSGYSGNCRVVPKYRYDGPCRTVPLRIHPQLRGSRLA